MSVIQRPGISREFIESNRRKDFVLAAAEIAHEFGVQAVTVSLLCRMARRARNSFYDQFDNVNDCLRYGIDEAFERFFAPLRDTATEEDEWLLGIHRAISGLYSATAAEPLLAELILVHSFGVPTKPGDADFDSGVNVMIDLLAEGRKLPSPGGGPPIPITEEYLARVVVNLAGLKLSRDEAASLPSHSREMTMLVGNAYLGPEATARILASVQPAAQLS